MKKREKVLQVQSFYVYKIFDEIQTEINSNWNN